MIGCPSYAETSFLYYVRLRVCYCVLRVWSVWKIFCKILVVHRPCPLSQVRGEADKVLPVTKTQSAPDMRQPWVTATELLKIENRLSMSLPLCRRHAASTN